MKTAIKFDKLKGMRLAQAKNYLKSAANFELQKTQILFDMYATNPGMLSRKTLDANGMPKFMAPSEERIKAYLISRPELFIGHTASNEQKAMFQQKYATGSGNPILVDLAAQFAAYFHSNMPDIDTGWMQLFDLIDLRTSSHDHFDVDDTNAGITYTQINPGAQIKKRTKISEARTQCYYMTQGAGLGILDDWITKQYFWKIDEAIAEFNSKHYDQMANIHYSLFTAIGAGINQAFTTDDPTTFNAAAAQILRNLRNMGYGVGQNTGFKIVCAPEKVGRVTKMLSAQQGSQLVAFGTAKEPIAYTVDAVISSVFVPAADLGYYLVLPGRKIKRGLWQDLNLEQQRDAASRATDWFASAQYNGLMGDVNQVRRVLYT